VWHQSTLRELRGRPSDEALDALLATPEPNPTTVRALAAAVIHAAHVNQADRGLRGRLGGIQAHLEKHEHLLPVRTVWLVALALSRLAGGDVLTLARARDRLLERLYQNGLTPENDLPSFLRFTGSAHSDRFKVFRDWLLDLPGRVKHWLTEVSFIPAIEKAVEQTAAYAKLILAFGFARLGEGEMARLLQLEAHDQLAQRDEAHDLLLEAFNFRINQALNGAALGGNLPADQLEKAAQLTRELRYPVERLRQHLKILEPHEVVWAYRSYYMHVGDALSRALRRLPDVQDHENLEKKFEELFRRHSNQTPEDRQSRVQILQAALELAPRMGEAFTLTLLPQVPETAGNIVFLPDRASLLQRAIFVAAHFDQGSWVADFVTRFHAILDAPQDSQTLEQLSPLAGECFRSLRKLGMYDTIHEMTDHLQAILLHGKSIDDYREQVDWDLRVRSLLQVAAARLYFGHIDQALPILEEARQLLYQGELPAVARKRLACAYVTALGQAPAEVALRGIDELLARLTNVHDCSLLNARYFNPWKLDVIEAVVLGIVTEDFAMGNQARRWLDEEEFLVRRRIHQDVRTALS
jgi:hypothetical protein